MRIHLLACFVILFGLACGDDGPGGPDTGSISGTVTAEGAAALEGVTVTVGDLSATTDANGMYTVDKVPVGGVTVVFEVDDDIWEDVEVESSVGQGEPVTIDIELAIAMRVLAADKTLADAYNTSFDWTTDEVSVVYVPRPTHAALDRGMFWHNPELYDPPEAQITPTTPPAIGTPTSFDFPIIGGVHVGVQVLEQSTIVDTIAETPLTADEIDNGAMWEPAIDDFLRDWDLDAATPLYLAGISVESQEWTGSPILDPQTIEQLYLHEGDIWVKVVFNFVAVDVSVTDSDSDGLPEVFAKVTGDFVDGSVYDQLKDEYVLKEYGSKELRNIFDDVVDGLYSSTNASFVSGIGVPYESTEVGGTFAWPFAVVVHGNPDTSRSINIFLVEPAP